MFLHSHFFNLLCRTTFHCNQRCSLISFAVFMRFSSRTTMYLYPSIFRSSLTSFPVPVAVAKVPYRMMLSSLGFRMMLSSLGLKITILYVMCKIRFPPHRTFCVEVRTLDFDLVLPDHLLLCLFYVNNIIQYETNCKWSFHGFLSTMAFFLPLFHQHYIYEVHN